MVRIARSDFGFDFSFVLYDVTTLYFESFESDSFRETGFSKDHKHNQPQVVIGLIVTKDGFPIGYEVFKGDTFEGNTFIPIITAFKTRNKIESLTVVADSAMLSQKNIEAMQKEGLHYILSSRLANLKQSLLDQIDTALPRTNSAHIRIENLIVDFSSKRYRKDKREMDKQIEKAKKKITDSTKKVTNVKYVSNEKTKCFVNQALIDKHTKLLGLKGYVTDLTLPDTEIIAFYHNLFTVEHAFRIAKSDLETRPIYHRKEDSIRNHILICFMALSLSVYLELKNKASIESITEKLKQVTDALILDVITGKITHERVQKTRDIEELERLSY
jgi:transposase